MMIGTLNEKSPFTWTVDEEDGLYTILCEGMEVHDPDSNTYLSGMDKATCKEWIQKLISM